MICMVKTNKKGSRKDNIENLTKDWLGGFYIVLKIKSMVTVDRPLIDVGYNYNAWKFFSFIYKEDKVTPKAVIHYLSKYQDTFDNVAIIPFDYPIVMSKLFGSINEVDYHNKLRNSDLVLENYWFTKCGWIHLFTTFSMGITITNF